MQWEQVAANEILAGDIVISYPDSIEFVIVENRTCDNMGESWNRLFLIPLANAYDLGQMRYQDCKHEALVTRRVYDKRDGMKYKDYPRKKAEDVRVGDMVSVDGYRADKVIDKQVRRNEHNSLLYVFLMQKQDTDMMLRWQCIYQEWRMMYILNEKTAHERQEIVATLDPEKHKQGNAMLAEWIRDAADSTYPLDPFLTRKAIEDRKGSEYLSELEHRTDYGINEG